ncbi:hypothetical protein CUR178_02978 [Leishmania enriettii]|uniref:Uncharacterized protein n=1 Tax=Leishmania enriettii TaxID=5663 RepID=A0A836KHK1_LEIEN|nr:hypothetical protein CUR178_02978 [Leishmania enriettii]
MRLGDIHFTLGAFMYSSSLAHFIHHLSSHSQKHVFSMRRIVCSPCYRLLRHVVVGPSTTIPSATPTPQFGRRRQRLQKGLSSLSFDVENDRDAKNICFERYGFVQKPMFLETWQAFLRELQRVELRWSLAPSAGGTLQLKIHDHFEPGDGLLCELKGAANRSAPLAEFFEACGSLSQGAVSKYEIRFFDGESCSVLLIESKKRLGESTFKDEPPIVPLLCQFDCRGTSVSLSVLDEKTLVRTPLFSDISIQALNYAFLTSLPLFLKRTDLGIRNADFVTKDQMRHFRYAWCFLRKESCMTPVELGELDALLPP